MEMFFRRQADMPQLERQALELCRLGGGPVLDIGAGAGGHVLALAELGIPAEGSDACGEAVEVMKLRGVERALQANLWEARDLRGFRTILLLMNTIGVVGSYRRLGEFLSQLYACTSPVCDVVLDVSLPDWTAVHSAARRRTTPLRTSCFQDGEWVSLRCALSLGDMFGAEFPMLYAEVHAVAAVAAQAGWSAELAFQDEVHGHSLLRLSKQQRLSVFDDRKAQRRGSSQTAS